MITAAIGPAYDLTPEDMVGTRDSKRPRWAVLKFGIAGIVKACDDVDAQSDAALAATCTLYPPLVCQVRPGEDGVVINVIGN